MAADGRDDGRVSSGDGDGTASRRDVLRGIGSGAVVGAVGTGDGCCGGTLSAIESGDGTAPSRTQAGGGGDPIPEQITVTAGGREFTAPVERRIIRGTCQDLANFINSGGMRGVEDGGEAAGTASTPGSGGNTGGSGGQGSEGGDVQVGFECSDLPWWEGGGPEQGGGAAVAWTDYEWTVNGVPISGETYDTMLGPDPIGDVLTVDTVDVSGTTGGRLEITDVDISMGVDVKVVVPDWHPSHSISEECRQAWCSYITQIVDHERQHVQNIAQTAVETERRLNDVGQRLPDSVTSGTARYWVPVDGPTNTESPEEELLRKFEWVLGDYLDLAECERKRRTREFHAQESAIETFCESCTDCGEYNYRAITNFDSWTLYIQYSYSMSDQLGPYSDRYSGNYSAEFQLEPQTRGSFLRGLASFFGGLANGIGRLLTQLLGGSRDPVPDFGERLVFRGTGTVSASYLTETTGPGGTSRTVASGTKETESGAHFEIRRDKNEYILSWPTLDLPGLTTRGSGLTDVQIPVQTGELAMMQAQGDGLTGSMSEAADAVSDGIDPSDVDALAGIGEDMVSTWPIEGCERTLTQSIRQELQKQGDGRLGGRMMVSPNFDGPVVGFETLNWQLVPGEEERPAAPGHLSC